MSTRETTVAAKHAARLRYDWVTDDGGWGLRSTPAPGASLAVKRSTIPAHISSTGQEVAFYEGAVDLDGRTWHAQNGSGAPRFPTFEAAQGATEALFDEKRSRLGGQRVIPEAG
jgi:hypothetical protein